MSFLTLFSAPKPFTDPHIAVIQHNAIKSWTLLSDVEVLLIGDEQGVAEAAKELGVKHLPDVQCSDNGTPLISSMFQLARENSHSDLLCIINTDIILMPDFVEAAYTIFYGGRVAEGVSRPQLSKAFLVTRTFCLPVGFDTGFALLNQRIVFEKENMPEPIQLHLLQPGQQATITRINGASALRRRFVEMGIVKGETILIERHAPLGDPVEYFIKGYHLALRKEEAAQIDVILLGGEND